MKVVINKCFGGFGLSTAAYERLIELGVPTQKYIEEESGSVNNGKVIYDRSLTPRGESRINDFYWDNPEGSLIERYWDSWLDDDRANPLLVQVVEELGERASGIYSALKVVEIPDDIKWEIDNYDGMEAIDEAHRSWS